MFYVGIEYPDCHEPLEKFETFHEASKYAMSVTGCGCDGRVIITDENDNLIAF